MTRDEVMVMNFDEIVSTLDILSKRNSYENIGVSLDIIEDELVYGITIDGILEQEFSTLTELNIGLHEFAKNNLD